ncbi:threonine/serine exporter family protein [Pediococcus acidilactici]|uniref:threonine/serine exporter family protein n=1 Tax=Pediococcus acidilactici TaxID=1254 RepID=UPI001322CDC1|nr:threonine/serine exporter family protein [Pediococcus acidilactici]KAF0333526.1 threonine/serine exporter [Pediococcus acidilactici]KAF0335628.1 threonine/serine exporter [Pediococcus acidilactici]KAF0336942.1 threonine/serine exporter [Pediococcus acidilactici]KAF0339210.1 threonine/serine exporter [Pediococcus acidilactici]KAF0345108.1 threonine/serine exporter [Pediococcus acidilactici]
MQLLLEFVMAGIATVGFGIIINIPHRALLTAGIIGGISWGIYWEMLQFHLGLALSSLTATTVIALLSLFAARRLKMPMIVFSIPGIVPLVPGGQAYQMIRNFALSNTRLATHFMLEVGVIAGSIGIGFLMAEFIDRLQRKLVVRFKKVQENK